MTGGGSGIGRAIAMRLTGEGANVAVIDVREDAAAETVRMIEHEGGSALSVRCDVIRNDEVAAAVAAREQ